MEAEAMNNKLISRLNEWNFHTVLVIQRKHVVILNDPVKEQSERFTSVKIRFRARNRDEVRNT